MARLTRKSIDLGRGLCDGKNLDLKKDFSEKINVATQNLKIFRTLEFG